MTEHPSYWLIVKTRDGYTKSFVEQRLRVHFNGKSVVAMLGDSVEEIPVNGLYKDEEEPNYFPSPCWGEADEKFTYTWIDVKGSRIFCVHSEGFAEDLYQTLVLKKQLDELLKKR